MIAFYVMLINFFISKDNLIWSEQTHQLISLSNFKFWRFFFINTF